MGGPSDPAKKRAELGRVLGIATEPIVAVLNASSMRRTRFANSILFSDYWALTKSEVTFLIVVTTLPVSTWVHAGQ